MDQVVKRLADLYALWTGEVAAAGLAGPPPPRPDLEALIVRQQTEIALLNSAVAELEAEVATRDRQLRRAAPRPGKAPPDPERHDALAQQVVHLQAFADHQTTLLRDQTRQLAAQHRHLRARDALIRTLLRLLLHPPPIPEEPAAAPHGAGPWGPLPQPPTPVLQEELHLPGVLRRGVPLERCALSTRTHNALKRGGITTVNQLCRMTTKELLALNWMGPRSLDEIRRQLVWVWAQIAPSFFYTPPPAEAAADRDTTPVPPLA